MMQRTLFDVPPCPHCGSQPIHHTGEDNAGGWHQYECPVCQPQVEAAYGTGRAIEFRWSSTFPWSSEVDARSEWEMAVLVESTKAHTA